MVLDTVYVRHFRSFNFDLLRQDLTSQDRYPWDELVGVEDYEAEEVDEHEHEEDEDEEVEAGELDDEDAEDESPETESDDGPEAGLSPAPAPVEPPADSTVEEFRDESYYPFVKLRLERDITTVVGANESGKSQLIVAIQCLLGDHEIRPRDFCRYSKFFGVRRSMRLPEFGGRFTEVTSEERAALIADVGRIVPGDFWFFRLQRGPVLYVEGENGSITAVDLTDAQVETLPLPTARRIDANVVLPSSASLFDLASGQASPQPRSRGPVRRARDHDAWDPEWEHGTFLAQGSCGAAKCQQVVIATGTWRVDYKTDGGYPESYADQYATFYRVGHVHPPLRLMELPEDADLDEALGGVADALRTAGAVLLSAPGLAATALRSCVERFLSSEGVPSKTGKGGFRRWMTA